MAADTTTVARIAPGTYRVEHDGRSDIVYLAGPARDRWAFWNGRVFRYTEANPPGRSVARPRAHAAQALTAPMPATVVKVSVAPGSTVKKGDTVIVLEAMKMELPIRAPADATVIAVHCCEGDLVQPDTTLLELA